MSGSLTARTTQPNQDLDRADRIYLDHAVEPCAIRCPHFARIAQGATLVLLVPTLLTAPLALFGEIISGPMG